MSAHIFTASYHWIFVLSQAGHTTEASLWAVFSKNKNKTLRSTCTRDQPQAVIVAKTLPLLSQNTAQENVGHGILF